MFLGTELCRRLVINYSLKTHGVVRILPKGRHTKKEYFSVYLHLWTPLND